jgi:hypothetical protein
MEATAMKRILATAVLAVGLLTAPAVVLAGGPPPSPHVPTANSVFARQWAPKFAPGVHGDLRGHRPHVWVGHRGFAPSTVVIAPPVVVAQPVWVDAGWQWNGWQWVWVPGYWSW